MTFTLSLYNEWLETATPEQIALVDSIYAASEAHYEQGGNLIVEAFEPAEIIERFKSIEEVKAYCNQQIDYAKDHRWGSDDDPELLLEYWK
jgi:hypothetical protein